MRRPGFILLTLLLALSVGVSAQPLQTPQTPGAPQAPPPDSARPAPPPDSARPVPAPDADRQPPPDADRDPVEGVFDDDFGRSRRAAVRIGGDFTLGANDRIREVVVIFGNVTIDGTVDRHVVVIMGTARLGKGARIGDNFVVIGGPARVEEGAVVERDLVVIGGGLDAPAGFSALGEHVVIGPPFLGEWFEGFTAWITRGLLFGRLIVPDLSWVWGAVAIFFLLYLAVNVVFERPVHTIATTLAEKPLTAFGAGLAVLLLLGPVVTLLAITVVGIAVIPFLLCAIFIAWIVGKVAVARWIGNGVMPEDEPEHRSQAVRSFVIGFALILIAYMIPIVGIVTWAVIGVIGLGAASMAFLAAYRRERPAPPPSPVPEPPPPPVPTPYQPPAGASASVSEASAMSSGAMEPPAPPPFVPPVATPPAGAAGVAASLPSALLSMPRALFRDRFAAFVLDMVIVAMGLQVLDAVFFFDDEAFPLFVLVYHVGFWTWKQTTPGGIICQLRLVRVDGNPLSFADALIRALVGFFSIAVFFIGALWMLRDPDGQTWHDKVAGTYVMKVPRNWPL